MDAQLPRHSQFPIEMLTGSLPSCVCVCVYKGEESQKIARRKISSPRKEKKKAEGGEFR